MLYEVITTHFLNGGQHFLFFGHSHCTAFLRFGLGNLLVGLRLVDLKLCADVAPDIDVRDVNGQNLKRCTRVKPFGQHRFGNKVGVFQHLSYNFV